MEFGQYQKIMDRLYVRFHHETYDDDENYYIEVDVPRFKETDLEASIESEKINCILLTGENNTGSFEKRFEVLSTMNTDDISCKLEYGVLKVIIPKKLEAKPRLIAIK